MQVKNPRCKTTEHQKIETLFVVGSANNIVSYHVEVIQKLPESLTKNYLQFSLLLYNCNYKCKISISRYL